VAWTSCWVWALASVLVWQTQLMANDFPPVCAVTGSPAQTWQKFTFTKTPPWAFWVGGVILSAALAERVTGYLPLTQASAQKIRTLRWTFLGLLLIGFVLFGISFVVAANSTGPLWAVLFFLGLGALFAGLIGTLVGRGAMGPRGKLLDQQPGYYQLRLIELSNVHPAFVAAVQQHQQMRAQQAQRQ
jgi:hypothetical protein